MAVKLPTIIKKYIDAGNKHDVETSLSCFSEGAIVHDEGKELRGKKAIEGWLVKTIEKYKFQFKPLNVDDNNAEIVVEVEVSGTFDGSPVSLEYHFTLANDEILSLKID
jgi:hypothetical protein